MKNIQKINVGEMSSFLVEIAVCRPVFIWGPPGIGKSSVVEKFANDIGMECVTLLGSQLAAEDIMGIPKIENGVSRFYPPSLIVREKPFVLFIDELNTASHDVQKAFYSLILDHRVGEYKLPEGSVVVGAGNRQQDSAMARKLPSALINRMVHVEMAVNVRNWLDWAREHNIHELVVDYISKNNTKLVTDIPPADEKPFSSPRTWEYVSDSLHTLIKDGKYNEKFLHAVLYGSLTEEHVDSFLRFMKIRNNQYDLNAIIKGDKDWPSSIEETDVLMELALMFGRQLGKELSQNKKEYQKFKTSLKRLAQINPDLAKASISQEGVDIPSWFMIDISAEMPKLLK